MRGVNPESVLLLSQGVETSSSSASLLMWRFFEREDAGAIPDCGGVLFFQAEEDGGRPGPRLTVTVGSLLADEGDLGVETVELVRDPLTRLRLEDRIIVGEADFDFILDDVVEDAAVCTGDERASGLRGGRPGPRFRGMTCGVGRFCFKVLLAGRPGPRFRGTSAACCCR